MSKNIRWKMSHQARALIKIYEGLKIWLSLLPLSQCNWISSVFVSPFQWQCYLLHPNLVKWRHRLFEHQLLKTRKRSQSSYTGNAMGVTHINEDLKADRCLECHTRKRLIRRKIYPFYLLCPWLSLTSLSSSMQFSVLWWVSQYNHTHGW